MAGFDPDVFGGGDSPPAFDPEIFGAPKPLPVLASKQAKGTGSDAGDYGNALGTGFWRGMTRLAGLPADTAANVLDLGKAGLGSAYTAVTGKAAPDALQVGDRANVVGSGDWLIKKLGGTALGNAMVNPANPDFEGGYTQAAGSGLTAVINPNNARQAVNQAVLGVTGAMGGKAVADATGNPAYGVIGSLVPSGVQQAITAGTKAAVIGANPFSAEALAAKRAEIADRMTTLRNAGVENPTLGLATGNRFIGGVENLLQNTPGAIGTMGRSRDAAIGGLQAKADEAANLASTNRGAMESGVAIQNGIKGFKDNFKTRQGQLYDQMDYFISPQSPAGVTNTQGALANLNADIQGAPAVSKFFKNSKLQALEDAIRSDTAGSPASVHVYSQPPIAGGGLMNAPIPQPVLQVQIPAGPPRNTLPWQAVKQTRTMIGNEIADNSLISPVSNNKWRPLYGALSEDMGQAAAANGPAAQQAFNRATDFTRSGAARLERVAPFAQTTAPEQAFTAMVNASRENVSTLQAVKKTLPEDARGTVAGTVIERLGRANNGVQNAEGTAWSPDTFLTNWNKMAPKARDELFSGFPNSAEVAQNVDNVAKAASMMRESSKMWANPSGSGANLAARGLLAGLGAAGGSSLLGLLNPLVPLGIGGGLLATRGAAGALTNPELVRQMTQGNYVSPQQFATQTLPMFSSGLLN